MGFTSMSIFLFTLATTVLAQLSPPAQGVQLGNLSLHDDFRFPETVRQCEPVVMYYDTSKDGYTLYLTTPDRFVFLRIPIPNGTRYIEWICDIPAGYGFTATYHQSAYFVVQPGSSSSCLQPITATYDNGRYDTDIFESYTAHPPNTTLPSINPLRSPSSTVNMPVESFPTITVNAAGPIASVSPFLSPSVSSRPRPSKLSRSQLAAVIIGVIGGLAMIIIPGIIFVWWLRRRAVSSRGIVNPLDESDKTGARGNPFDPNWMERSDAASQTSRAEPMTINDASYLPTVLVPEIVDPVNAPDIQRFGATAV